MVRKLLTALIIFAYIYGINISLVCLADYYLEYNYIAENLCVKKDIPDNDCCGKCFLKKNLDETSGQKKESGTIISDNSLTLHLVSSSYFADNNFEYSGKQLPASDHLDFSRSILPEKLPPRSFLSFNS